MKENDLRRAFGRITPDETLIRATIERVEVQKHTMAAQAATRMTQGTRRMPPYAMAARLAGAVCALVLMVSIGILVGKNALMPTVDGDGQPYTRKQFNHMASEPAAAAEMSGDTVSAAVGTYAFPASNTVSGAEGSYDQAALDGMISRARESEGEWLVLDAALCSCYILPESESSDGRLGCLVAFDDIKILDAMQNVQTQDGQEVAALFRDSANAPACHVYFEDAQARNALIDAMGSRMCVLVRIDGDMLIMDASYLLSK